MKKLFFGFITLFFGTHLMAMEKNSCEERPLFADPLPIHGHIHVLGPTVDHALEETQINQSRSGSYLVSFKRDTLIDADNFAKTAELNFMASCFEPEKKTLKQAPEELCFRAAHIYISYFDKFGHKPCSIDFILKAEHCMSLISIWNKHHDFPQRGFPQRQISLWKEITQRKKSLHKRSKSVSHIIPAFNLNYGSQSYAYKLYEKASEKLARGCVENNPQHKEELYEKAQKYCFNVATELLHEYDAGKKNYLPIIEDIMGLVAQVETWRKSIHPYTYEINKTIQPLWNEIKTRREQECTERVSPRRNSVQF